MVESATSLDVKPKQAVLGRFGPQQSRLAEACCPFMCEAQQVCQVSISALRIDAHRSRLCCSDDFDSCVIYLAHLLRRSRPKRTDSDWLDAL